MTEISKKNYGIRFGIAILFVICVLGGSVFGYYIGVTERVSGSTGDEPLSFDAVLSAVKDSVTDDSVDPGLFEEVWNAIGDQYVDAPVDEKTLFYGALRGLVAGIGDPYSRFLDPEETNVFNQELNGSFEGIGTEIGIKQNQLTVIAPLPDSPAARAGLKSHDQIRAIDGVDTTNMGLDTAVGLIRGPQGTDVVLTIFTEGDVVARDVTITRDVITVESLTWSMLDNDIAYVEITHFDTNTDTDFRAALQEILLDSPRGMIIDVRNNPGGFLNAVVEVGGMLLPDNSVVVMEQSGGTRTEYQGHNTALMTDVPIVVLVNGGSASASEILAGALQDYDRATIIGEQTFGKGSVQDYEQFSDGSSLKLTVSKWLTPLGNSIDEEGITPDEVVELTEEDYNNDIDPQLDRAISILTE